MVAAALVCLLTTGRAGAGYDEGMTAFAAGDYDTAYRELRPLAEKGEPGAQFTLGFMYDYGQGVPQNTQEAIWWYRNAAEQDIAVAQFSLGEIYEGGRGTPQDLAEAYRWYSLALENLLPGEIRDSVIERRDAVAGKLTPDQIAVVTALMNGTRGQRAAQEQQAAETSDGTEDATLVAAIQGELARLGYALDWRLGSLDRATRGAIQAFEIESGREVTGLASEALLAALRATGRPGAGPDAGAAGATASQVATTDGVDAATPGAATASPAGGDVLDAPAGLATSEAASETGPETAPGPAQGPRVAALDEPGAVSDAGPAAESTVDVPSGAAGGPLIPLDDETRATQPPRAALAGTTQQAALPDGTAHDGVDAADGAGWDLRFVERQIKRLDAITERVDGPSAAVPGWSALESWELETRGLLAARLGQEVADGLSQERQAPVVGDPYGNFHHASAAYRGYLSRLLNGR